MSISLRCCRVVTALLLLASSTIATADPCDELRSRSERQTVNLGSSYELPISANHGPLPAEVQYVGFGHTGTSFRFLVDGAIEVRRNGFEANRWRYVGQAGHFTALQPRSSATQVISPTVSWHLADFGALKQHIAPDVDAEIRLRSRQLRSTWHGDGDLAAIAIDVTNLQSAHSDGTGGLALDFADGQQWLLHAARVEGDAEQRVPFVWSDGFLRLDPQQLGAVAAGSSLEVVVDVAPYFHAYDAVRTGESGTGENGVAVLSVTADAGGDSAADLVLTRLNFEGELVATTVLTSMGDDLPVAITASAQGDVYLAASTAGADWRFAGAADKGSTAHAFVAHFSGEDALLAGRYSAVDGFTSLHDLAISEDGLLLSGQSEAVAEGLAVTFALPIDTVPIDTVPVDGPVTDYVVAELTENLEPTGLGASVSGADAGISLEIWPGCQEGRPWIGPRPVALAQGSCTSNLITDTYAAFNPNPAGFIDGWVNTVNDGWGYHALRWKTESQFLPTYNPPSIAPTTFVQTNDHTQLNQLEGNSNVFPTNPAGIWLKNTSITPLELAIGAALYMDFWRSPSYANLKLPGESLPRPAALMEVEFCVNSSFGQSSVHDYCAQTALLNGITTARYPIDEVDRLCGFQWGQGAFFIRQVEVDHWQGGTTFSPGRSLTRAAFETSWNDAIGVNGWYIADPPVDSEAAPAFVEEISSRLSGHAMRPIATREIEVDASGQVVAESVGQGLIRALAGDPSPPQP